MAQLVAAFASSHSVMLTCTAQDWQTGFRTRDPKGSYFDREGNPRSYDEMLARAPANAAAVIDDAVVAQRHATAMQAIARLKDEVQAAKLDVLIVCGDDQHELFGDDLMPPLVVYYGPTIRNARRKAVARDAWYQRAQMLRLEENADVEYPCDPKFALHLIDGLVHRDFDVTAMKAFKPEQYEGHACSFVHRFYLAGAVVPIVPIFLNTYYPPNQPTPARCLALGKALGELIKKYPGNARVGFVASGGLSHFQVEEDLDEGVLDALRRKDLAYLAGLNVKRLQAGSSEIRNWIVLGGLADDLEMNWSSYTPGYRTPALTGTGLGFASWRRA
jgi:3-O-methylgallate 3,4-dioxygenase